MLWYKMWRETRWRFFIGLLLLSASCALVVLTRPLVSNIELNELPGLSESMREMIREVAALMITYPGYIWSQWFGKNLLNMWALFAVIIGAGGVATEAGRGTALLTLSLPVTRRRLQGERALLGAIELLALAVVPSLLVPLLSPLIGETYPVGSTIIYALLAFAGGLVFFSFAQLLSTIFSDQIKPIIIGIVLVFIPSLLPLIDARLARYSIYTLMSGRSFFERGELPWAGLATSLAVAALMFALSLRILERRDF